MHGFFGSDTYCRAPTEGLLNIAEVVILDRKVTLDRPLNERGGYARFDCTDSYRVRMHKEQTSKLSSLYI